MTPPLVVGNWKMYGSQSECISLARQIVRNLRKKPSRAEVVLAPPFTALATVKRAIRGTKIGLAGQNSHWQENGAFTGEVSPTMLRDVGCDFVILGHSERRYLFYEDNQAIGRKIVSALRNGLRPILCVGETLDQRSKGLTVKVITDQLRVALKGVGKSDISRVEIAYEPVWAIGTGHNATPEQITQAHTRIRRFLVATFGETKGSRVRILYGGSVKSDNAVGLAAAPEVSGLLVGGASLKAETFLPIVHCFNSM